MTDRIIFTHVTAKALQGIRNIFGTVYVQPTSDGRFTVLVRR